MPSIHSWSSRVPSLWSATLLSRRFRKNTGKASGHSNGESGGRKGVDLSLIGSGAVISECGNYRYVLHRGWGTEKSAVFIMLNPSTADGFSDDSTIRRCIGFSKRWGCGGIVVVNLFAFRAKSPKHMIAARDPIGPENMSYIIEAVRVGEVVVCAWGTLGAYQNQDIVVVNQIHRTTPNVLLMALGITKHGFPRHPLYLPNNSELAEWDAGKRLTSNGQAG